MQEIYVLVERNNAWGAFTLESDAELFKSECAQDAVNIVKVKVDPVSVSQMMNQKPYKVIADRDGRIRAEIAHSDAGLAAHQDKEVYGTSLYVYSFAFDAFHAIRLAQPEIEIWMGAKPQDEPSQP